MTLEEHITQRFEKLFADYRKELARAQKRGSEEAVHQLRVASRRILENLKVFEGAIRRGAARPIRRSLKRWMRASGAVRDYDIAIQLAESSGSEPALAAASIWQRKRAGRWKRVLPQVREASVWKGDTPATTLSAGEETGQSVIWDGALPAARNASLALPLLLDRYVLHGDALHKSALDETGRPSGDLDDSAYHQFRLRTKRIRYALESFEAFYPREPYRELLGSLKNFQQILGNLHDCEVASGMLESTARKGGQEPGEGTGEAEAALVAGGPEADSFAAFLIERRGGLRDEWHQAWERFASSDAQRVARTFLREAAAEPLSQPVPREAKREAAEAATACARKAS